MSMLNINVKSEPTTQDGAEIIRATASVVIIKFNALQFNFDYIYFYFFVVS